MTIDILHPGVHTTIQDLGRPRARQLGLSTGGAADSLALRVANWLVGNPEDAACLECRLVGPRLRFARETAVAICGARVKDRPSWTPFVVRKGELLDLSHLKSGVYAYVAVAGGMDVPVVLGGRGTDTRIGLGGFQGRALRAGDHLKIGEPPACTIQPGWRVHHEAWYDKSPIRVVRGEQWDEFSPAITGLKYKVSSRSDRMGVRLSGSSLHRRVATELASGAVAPGTVQVPPDGNPIVLLSDAQTLGGYPKIAHVTAVDLPRVAQCRPGAVIQFTEVIIEEAHDLQLKRSRELARLRYAIQVRRQ